MPVPLPERNHWIDNLRSTITVLVVAHHAALAYTSFSVFDKTTYINSTHPIVDDRRWAGLDFFVSFNDSFFMPLLFLISGLFFFSGLEKKGWEKYLLDRTKRLGIPFLIAEFFIIPVAYIPSYWIANEQFEFGAFLRDYLFHQQWPVGPPWFIWLLLAFTGIALLIPKKFFSRAAEEILSLIRQPLLFVVTFIVASAILFVPLSMLVGPYKWTGIGVFDFQLNRVFFYFAYFLFGAVVGSVDWQNYFFRKKEFLGKPGFFWVLLTIASFLIQFFAGLPEFFQLVLYTSTCTFAVFTFITLYRNGVNTSSRLWRNLAACAFGIYLIHYVFITWFQYGLLTIGFPVVGKFEIVFLLSFGSSWTIMYLWKQRTRHFERRGKS